MTIQILDIDGNIIHCQDFDDYLELIAIANHLWTDSVHDEAYQMEQERDEQMRKEMYEQLDEEIEATNYKHTQNSY